MKTKSTLTVALMVLSAFIGSFLAGLFVDQRQVIAAGQNNRYMGWPGRAPLASQTRFFILDTASGEVDWFSVTAGREGSTQQPSTVNIRVFRFKHGNATGRQIR